MRGDAYPISPGAQHGELELRGRKAAEKHMSISKEEGGFDWEKEIRKVWEVQNPKTIKSKYPAPVSSPNFHREEREMERNKEGDACIGF